ncbi:MAG: LolA family protein [Candidatus Polarisedimenticolia bacterium]
MKSGRTWRLATLTMKLALLLASAGPHAGAAAMAAAPVAADEPELREFLKRFDAAQAEATTVVARFTETRRLRLLAKPLILGGRFTFMRPNRVRWEYDAPDRRVFVLTENRYVAFYPDERRAEEVEIKSFVGKRLFRFLGVGQSSADLAKYYDMRPAEGSGPPGTRLLLLTPRRKRIEERVAAMKIWVDATTFLPRQVAYEEPDGDGTVISFEAARTNVPVGGRTFEVDLPSGVVRSQVFGGLARGH